MCSVHLLITGAYVLPLSAHIPLVQLAEKVYNGQRAHRSLLSIFHTIVLPSSHVHRLETYCSTGTHKGKKVDEQLKG